MTAIWRGMWTVPLYASVLLTAVCLSFMYGPRAAVAVMRKASNSFAEG